MKIAIALNDYMQIKIDLNIREIEFDESQFNEFKEQLGDICDGFFLDVRLDDIERINSYLDESKSEVLLFNQGDNDFSLFESDKIIPFLMNNKINFQIKGY